MQHIFKQSKFFDFSMRVPFSKWLVKKEFSSISWFVETYCKFEIWSPVIFKQSKILWFFNENVFFKMSDEKGVFLPFLDLGKHTEHLKFELQLLRLALSKGPNRLRDSHPLTRGQKQIQCP
jgi:hypothetical protein